MPSGPWKDDDPEPPGHPYFGSLGDKYQEFLREEAKGNVEWRNDKEDLERKLDDTPPKPPLSKTGHALYAITGAAFALIGRHFDDGTQDDQYRLATGAFTLYHLCTLTDKLLFPDRTSVTPFQKGIRGILCGASAYLVSNTFELNDFERVLHYTGIATIIASAGFLARELSRRCPEPDGLDQL